jgi:uncharacterized RDD family membrane protein YckC
MNYAGFWIRGIAILIDFTLLTIAESPIDTVFGWIFKMSVFNQQILGEIFSFVLIYFYYCRWQVKFGTTIGKRIFGLYVVDEKTGEFLSHKQACIRTLMYLVSLLIVGCGFLMAAFHPQKKTLHDICAGTVVVRNPKRKESIAAPAPVEGAS